MFHKTTLKTDALFMLVSGIIHVLEKVSTSHKNPSANAGAS